LVFKRSGQAGSVSNDDHQSGITKKIIPDTIEDNQAGFSASILYGLFDISASALVDDSLLTHLSVNITPDYWYYYGVRGRWTPFGVEPIGLDLEGGGHGDERTNVNIDKRTILSNGSQVGLDYTPGYLPLVQPQQGLPYIEWGCAPNVGISWENLDFTTLPPCFAWPERQGS